MRAPVQTLIILAAVVAIDSVPGARDWLIYDRAAIETGEFRRLFTGHLCHFTTEHLAWNALVVATAGAWIELRRIRGGALLLWAGPWTISVGLFLLEPNMVQYGGLSALATAAVALIALSEKCAWLFCAVVIKAIIGSSWMAFDAEAVVSGISHQLGALTGIGVFAVGRVSRGIA